VLRATDGSQKFTEEHSEDTIKVHAKKLFAKTGVHDRAAAVAWAFRSGVLA
jgi:DNA-binding NarL/FixJ family response regulator